MTEKKIFILDDDRDILDSMKMILEFKGYQVHTSAHPEKPEQYISTGSGSFIDRPLDVGSGWFGYLPAAKGQYPHEAYTRDHHFCQRQH